MQNPSGEMTSAQKAMLILILAVALALRLHLIWHDYPYTYNPDEPFYVQEGIYLAAGHLPTYYARPTFYLYFLALADALFYGVGRLTGLFSSLTDFQLYYISHTADFTMIARLVSAAFSWLTVFLVFEAGRRFYGPLCGLAAAALLAVSPLHVEYAHQAVTDTAMVFWSTFVLLGSFSILKGGSSASYAISGLFVGLATATKYPAVFSALAVAAAHFARADRKGLFTWFFRPRVAYAVAAAALGFLIGCPFVIIDYHKFMRDVLERIQIMSAPWIGLNPYSTGFELYIREVFLKGEGMAWTAACCAAVLFLLARHRREDLVLLAFPVPFFIYIGLKQYAADRYVMPALPYFEVALGAFLVFLAEMILKTFAHPRRSEAPSAPRAAQNALLALITALVLIQPAWNVVQKMRDWARPQIRVDALNWIEANIPRAGNRLFVDYTTYAPPLTKAEGGVRDMVLHFAAKYNLSEKDPLIRKHLSVLEGHPEYYLDMITYPTSPTLAAAVGPELPWRNYDYVIICGVTRHMVMSSPDYPVLAPFRRFFQSLETQAQLVARFEPRKKTSPTGPIEVYKVHKNTPKA